MRMKAMHMVAFILLIVGGINWLLVGVFGSDIGGFLFGGMDAPVSRLIARAPWAPVLVGAAAIYEVATHKKSCRACGTDAASMPQM